MKIGKIKQVQVWLKELNLYDGKIDGLVGPKTLEAIRISGATKYLKKNLPTARYVTAFVQFFSGLKSIDAGPIDGFWGPQTEHAYNELIGNNFVRDEYETISQVTVWPTYSELTSFFGPRGSNLVSLKCPYELVLDWNLNETLNEFSINAKCKDSAERVLNKVLDYYDEEGIKKLGLNRFGGCFNNRLMRGGSSWSTHAWAVAIDFYPSKNQLRQNHTTALFAKPEYEFWWTAWEEEGWVSLGRTKDYDWMHVQACR